MFEALEMTGQASDGDYALRMAVRASDVAAEIRRRVPGVGTKKLHKLLYYCQGHHLASFGLPIFRESLSAWDIGPVVGRLWWSEKAGSEQAQAPAAAINDEAVLNTVGYVISRYGRLSVRDLEHMTHAEDPWQRANELRDPGESERIPNEWILDYFRSSADEEDAWQLDQEQMRAFLASAPERR